MDFEEAAKNFSFLEAPCVDGDRIWFSEVMLGGLHCLQPDGTVDEWLAGRKWIGGVVLNADGSILCSGADGVAWVNPTTGASGMLLDSIDGQPVLGVNDMLPDNEGGLYFGTIDVAAFENGTEQRPTALYRLAVDGRITQLAGDLPATNGIGLSPDGTRLYHNESSLGLCAYDLLADGSLANKRVLAEQPDCDGLAVDADGGIWIAGYASPELKRVLPDGTIERRITLPVPGATSLCFGGADGRDLYVTTLAADIGDAMMNGRLPSRTAALYRARSGISGLAVGRTSFRLTS